MKGALCICLVYNKGYSTTRVSHDSIENYINFIFLQVVKVRIDCLSAGTNGPIFCTDSKEWTCICGKTGILAWYGELPFPYRDCMVALPLFLGGIGHKYFVGDELSNLFRDAGHSCSYNRGNLTASTLRRGVNIGKCKIFLWMWSQWRDWFVGFAFLNIGIDCWTNMADERVWFQSGTEPTRVCIWKWGPL